MLIDTGASGIALSRDDARTAGLATSIGMNDIVGEGADGEVHGEYVKLDRIELGPLSASGLDAVVLNSGQQSLLGQSFLEKFSSVQIEGDRMVLR
jgi:aspartyl protease family protein